MTQKGDITQSVHVLNFNYTSTARKYLESNYILQSDREVHINDIHGRLNDAQNPMIFGYGDETGEVHKTIENFNENELTRNMKSFHYLLSSNYQALFDFIESGTFSVSIMGHSCGLSDRVLLSNIFQHKNLKKIQQYYHKIDDKQNDFFTKTQNISRHFDSNSKHSMRYKIVPLEKCSPLTEPSI